MIADNIRTRKLEGNKFKTTHLIVDSKTECIFYQYLFQNEFKCIARDYELFILSCLALIKKILNYFY